MEHVLDYRNYDNMRSKFNKGNVLVIPFNIGIKKHNIYLTILEIEDNSKKPFQEDEWVHYSFKLSYKHNECNIEFHTGVFSEIKGKERRMSVMLRKEIFPYIPVNELIFLSSNGILDEVHVLDEVKVKVKSLVELECSRPNHGLKYKTPGSSGFDFYSIEEVIVPPRSTVKVRTGICMEIPIGYELQVRPRSGLADKKKLTILNTPGTVDSDYRGEICLLLTNHSNDSVLIKEYDRVAQGVICKVSKAIFEQVDELSTTERNEGGFGSTGV